MVLSLVRVDVVSRVSTPIYARGDTISILHRREDVT